MNDLTVVVLTKDEERHLAECLRSVQWADRLLVLDSLSTDRTVQIAHQMGAQIASRPFTNFGEQRNAALALVQTEWVFFVDADERVSPELAQEVRAVIQRPDYAGWWVPTRNNFFGKWLGHGGFYPDYHLRLARKERLRYDPQQRVHESPTLDGQAGYLENPLLHLCYQSLGELRQAKSRYAALLAETHFERGLKPSYHLLAAPILAFYQQLIALKGYRDGRVGWLISLAWAYYAFDEYRRLWLLWRSAGRAGS